MLLFLGLLALLAVPAAIAQAPPPDAAAPLRGFSRVYQALADHVRPSVVQIFSKGFGASSSSGSSVVEEQRGIGSGVIVDAAGYILTNAHVVGDARKVQVILPQHPEPPGRSVLRPGGRRVEGRVVGVDRETDLAVIKVDGAGLPHLPFADSDQVRQGQLVFAFGSPYGLDNTMTMGIVSSVARQVRPDDPMIYLQTDASINPGNSGGPLIDAAGAIVGINTFILSQSGGYEGIGFAAPSNIARRVHEQIREFGRVKRGQIGVLPQTITPSLAEALKLPQDWGVLVADLTPGGSAAAAGLEINDIIVKASGRLMENARQLGVNIYPRAGQQITLDILRAGKPKTIEVAVLERPKDPDRILSIVEGDGNVVPQLGILAVTLDEKVTPLLPSLRKLTGVVVAGIVARVTGPEDSLRSGDVIYSVNGAAVATLAELQAAMARLKRGDPVALHVERSGQLQYVLLDVE